MSFRSQHTRLAPLRVWFRWMARQHYILNNPASEIELPRLEFQETTFALADLRRYSLRERAALWWVSNQSDDLLCLPYCRLERLEYQLRTALRLLDIREPEVVIFEFVSLPTGSMSTRKGKFISADELLDEVEKQAFEEVRLRRPEESEAFLNEVAAQVAAGAVRYDVVKVSPDKATTFDWKQALDFEKLSAPFIQYSHARACSILRKGEEGQVGQTSPVQAGLLTGENEIALIKKIAQFDLVIDKAARELKPHQLATYARELAESFNLFYRGAATKK
jgi:arginyl-tRNA synthetase